MPFAQIYMLEGRTEEQKRAVIEKVTQALVEADRRTEGKRARLDPRRTEGKLGHCRRLGQALGR